MSLKRVAAIVAAVGVGVLAVANGTVFVIVLITKVTVMSPTPALALLIHGTITASLAWTARGLWQAFKPGVAS